MYKINFINLEEDDKDLIASFAIEDSQVGVRSLILHRTLFLEEFLDENERGVNVSFGGGADENDDLDMLEQIEISINEIKIRSVSSEYQLDVSQIEPAEIDELVSLLRKQNHDDRFIIHVT